MVDKVVVPADRAAAGPAGNEEGPLRHNPPLLLLSSSTAILIFSTLYLLYIYLRLYYIVLLKIVSALSMPKGRGYAPACVVAIWFCAVDVQRSATEAAQSLQCKCCSTIIAVQILQHIYHFLRTSTALLALTGALYIIVSF